MGTTCAEHLEEAASVQTKDLRILIQCRRQTVGNQRGPRRHAGRVGHCATEMTTYSWRRTGPTFAQLLQMTTVLCLSGVEPVTDTVTPVQWVTLDRSCDW